MLTTRSRAGTGAALILLLAACGTRLPVPPRVATFTSDPIEIRIVNDTGAPIEALGPDAATRTPVAPGSAITTSVVVAVTKLLDDAAGLPWWTIDPSDPAAELVETGEPRRLVLEGDWRFRLVDAEDGVGDLLLSVEDCLTLDGRDEPTVVSGVETSFTLLRESFEIHHLCTPADGS